MTTEVARHATELLTFLFTDIEGSTRLLDELGPDFVDVLTDHHRLLRDAIREHGGQEVRTEGDSFFAVFRSVDAAVLAAVDAQRSLQSRQWPGRRGLHVRMGLHTGEATIVEDEFVGLEVHRGARVMSVAWGDQIVVSDAVRQVAGDLGAVGFRDLGEHRLKDISTVQRLHQVDAEGLRQEFPPLRSLDLVTVDLPRQVTSFVGRTRELEEVAALLSESPIVTLIGPGGTGKTRLSIEVAAAVADNFADGVHFVELAPIDDSTLVLPTIARTLGLVAAAGQPVGDVLVDHLRQRSMLLVLDNLEQVLGAGSDIAKVVGEAAGLRVLVTSRAPLRIYGEQEYPLEPLDAGSSTGSADSDATRLFAERVAAVRPDLVLDADSLPLVTEIVRRVDGLPLAIELIAARTRVLSLAAILDRLAHSLDLLSSGASDLPPRQQTLRGAIAWSHDLLDDRARRLFARMSVFRGGVALEDLEAICADTVGGDLLDALGELVDHSLVRRPSGASGRFDMLETIREFAAEQLPDGDPVRLRHVEIYLDLAETALPALTGSDPGPWLDRLGLEHDNMRAALTTAMRRDDPSLALRLVGALWRFWQIRGHLDEGIRHADAVVALPGVETHSAALAAALDAVGGMRYWRGEMPQARAAYVRALDLYRETGDSLALARGLYNLGFAEHPDAERCMARFVEARDLFVTAGDELGVARCDFGLSVAAFWLGDFASVPVHGMRAIPFFERAGERYDLAWTLHMVGLGHYGLGNLAEALRYKRAALDHFRAVGDLSGIYLLLTDLALIAEAAEQDELSMRLLGAVDALSTQTGSGLAEPQWGQFPRERRSEDALGPERAAALRAEGAALSLDEVLALADGLQV